MYPCRQTEMDEAVAVLKEKHEREKNLLTEENRKLTAETDKVTASWLVSVWFLTGFGLFASAALL